MIEEPIIVALDDSVPHRVEAIVTAPIVETMTGPCLPVIGGAQSYHHHVQAIVNPTPDSVSDFVRRTDTHRLVACHQLGNTLLLFFVMDNGPRHPEPPNE